MAASAVSVGRQRGPRDQEKMRSFLSLKRAGAGAAARALDSYKGEQDRKRTRRSELIGASSEDDAKLLR